LWTPHISFLWERPEALILCETASLSRQPIHRAFDAGLIYLDEQFRMQLNDGNVLALQQLNLVRGLRTFKAPLGQIFLPPDPAQRPSADFIRRANKFRQISP